MFSDISTIVRPFVVWFLTVHGAATIAGDVIRPLALPGPLAFFIGASVGIAATVLFWGLIKEIVEMVHAEKSGE
jgi:hypothetical protein